MSAAVFHAVVPAAGEGLRMAAARPKQYLALAGATVIEHALEPLLRHVHLGRLVVALADGDTRFSALPASRDRRVSTVRGGATRAASVRAGLRALLEQDIDPAATVLVHDAARPCVPATDIDRVLAACRPAGALLAVRVRDTLKHEDGEGGCVATVSRDGLWQALTPQAFPLGMLADALAMADDVTDEAEAMERAGYRPALVEADPVNVKITRPGDLALVEALIGARHGVQA